MRRLILRSMLNHKPVYYRRRRATPYLFQTEAAFLCQMSGIASMAGRIGGARLAGTCSPVYQSQPVITLAMMDKAHRRPEDTAGRNFRAHQNKLIEGKDDFVRNSYEAK